MMKKYLIIFLLIVLFVGGCQKEATESSGPFIGGTDGVSVEFEDLTPPAQFNQGENVPVKVLLQNKGEYDIVTGNAKAKIYGINYESFGLNSNYLSNTGMLRGKGEFIKDGGEQEISFGNLNYNQEVLNSQDFVIRSKVCYPYQTSAIVDVCMKSANSEESTVCNIEGEKVTTGSISAAPIQITSLTQATRGSNQVRFDMKIENKGTGNVYSNDASCEDLEDDINKMNYKDRIYLEVMHPLDVTCGFRTGEDSNKGELVLDNGVEEISCWTSVENTYEDKLRIALKYMYTDTTQKPITIYEV